LAIFLWKKRIFLLNVSLFHRIFWNDFYRFLEREAGCFRVFSCLLALNSCHNFIL